MAKSKIYSNPECASSPYWVGLKQQVIANLRSCHRAHAEINVTMGCDASETNWTARAIVNGRVTEKGHGDEAVNAIHELFIKSAQKVNTYWELRERHEPSGALSDTDSEQEQEGCEPPVVIRKKRVPGKGVQQHSDDSLQSQLKGHFVVLTNDSSVEDTDYASDAGEPTPPASGPLASSPKPPPPPPGCLDPPRAFIPTFPFPTPAYRATGQADDQTRFLAGNLPTRPIFPVKINVLIKDPYHIIPSPQEDRRVFTYLYRPSRVGILRTVLTYARVSIPGLPGDAGLEAQLGAVYFRGTWRELDEEICVPVSANAWAWFDKYESDLAFWFPPERRVTGVDGATPCFEVEVTCT